MKKIFNTILILLMFAVVFTSCAASRKSQGELKGLMLLDNLKLPRNKAFYSKHNMRTKNMAYRKYRKNSKLL
jgi:hypothetical protein